MNQAQLIKSNQIAEFLRRRVAFVQNASGDSWGGIYSGWQTLPTIEQFGKELVADAEFRSLQLGTLLSTTDAEVIEAAVAAVIPPIYHPEFDLAVGGLKLAAALQQQEGQQVAGRVALTFVGASLIAAGLVMAARSVA